MDSQDSHMFSQQNLNDSPISQFNLNSSQFQSPDSIPQSNSFAPLEKFQNQLNPLNLQFQRHFAFNPVSAPFSSQVQQLGPGFSFQGLINAPNLPFEKQASSISEGSKRKRKNSKNSQVTEAANRTWTTEEEIALTKAWLYISGDADIGSDQKLGTFWDRILQVWRCNMGDYDATRNNNALQCHWGKIQTAVSKFHGFYEQLKRNPPSGTTPEDMKKEASRMYMELNNGKPFKHGHCWEIMKKNPKWCSQQLTRQGTSKKQKTVNVSSIDNPTPSNGEDIISVDIPETEGKKSDGVPCPEGRKAIKEKKKVNAEKGVIDVLSQLQCTLERQIDCNREELELKKERDRKEHELREKTLKLEVEFKERNQKLKEKILKRKEQERILNKDLSNLQPALRVAYERIQVQILKEWENGDIFSENSDSHE